MIKQYYEKLKQNAIDSVTQKTMLDEHMWTQWFKYKNIPEMSAFEAFDFMCRGCYYCGDIALTADRLDSDEDHTLENCVGCCIDCNQSKGAIDPKTFVLQAVYRTTGEYPEGDDIWYEMKKKPIISAYKSRAEKQGKQFVLTKEQFSALISGMCAYCKRMPTTFFGIDKIDSSGGYTIGNCVTACTSCNWAKWDRSVDEFVARETRIAKRYFAGCFDDMKPVKKNISLRCLNTGKPCSGSDNHNSKKVFQYALVGTFIRPYDSVAEAADDIGGNAKSISKCARGELKSSSRFIWSYTKKAKVESYIDSQKKKIYRYALDGTFIRSYGSLAEAAEDVGGNKGSISDCANGKLKTTSKFRWSYDPPRTTQ